MSTNEPPPEEPQPSGEVPPPLPPSEPAPPPPYPAYPAPPTGGYGQAPPPPPPPAPPTGGPAYNLGDALSYGWKKFTRTSARSCSRRWCSSWRTPSPP